MTAHKKGFFIFVFSLLTFSGFSQDGSYERFEDELSEYQVSFGMHTYAFTKENPVFTKQYVFKNEVNTFLLNRHTGISYVFGYEYKYHQISKDTSLFLDLTAPLTNEYYHQFTLNYGFKLRAFTGKVTTAKTKAKLFLDLGMSYHFPLLNRHVGRVDANTKLVNQRISTFTDFRANAVVGWYPFNVFASYRLASVVKNKLPQPSVFEFGISWIFNEL